MGFCPILRFLWRKLTVLLYLSVHGWYGSPIFLNFYGSHLCILADFVLKSGSSRPSSRTVMMRLVFQWFMIQYHFYTLKGDWGCLMSPPPFPRPPAKSQGCHLIPLFCLLSCSSAYYYCSIYWWCHGVWHLSLESTWTPRLSVWPTLKKISQALKYINKLFWKLHHNTKTTFRFLQMIPKLTRRLQLQKYELLPQIVPYHVN